MMTRAVGCGAILITLGTAVGLALAEAGLRALQRARSKSFLDYGDTIVDGRLRPNFDEDVVGATGPVRWTNNAQGFRSSTDFEARPAPGTIRILSIGDSFTAGYRVGNEDTFSYKLGLWLNGFVVGEVLVSAVEEPDNGLRYLREEGLAWNPHVVLFGITLGNDIAQAYIARNPSRIGFRSGLEDIELPAHSLEDESPLEGAVRRAKNLLSRSRLVCLFRSRAIVSWYGRPPRPRLFDAINGFGVYLAPPPGEIALAYERLFSVLDDAQALCRAARVELVVAIFPQRYQVQPRDWDAAVSFYGLNPEAFDLAYPNVAIRKYCASLGVVCLDGTDNMREVHITREIDLYQPLGDMHWNGDGHSAWFDGVKDQLRPVIARVGAGETSTLVGSPGDPATGPTD
jgi:hypothetical protein